MNFFHHVHNFAKLPHKILIIGSVSAVLLSSAPISIAVAQPESPRPPLSYSDVTDLVTGAPMVMKATLAKVKKVNVPAADPSSQPQNYLLINATVDSLIRGDGGVAPTISFLVAAPPQGSNKSAAPKKKQSWMIFARSGAKAGEVQLISRHAMQRWTPELETRVRAITTELLDTDSPPSFIGIGDAFHISGTIAGEGETQIFLKTDTGAPVSLSVVRRPGQRPHWGVSLGEIVDEAAAPPARDTLLWYKLACFLPARLPPESTRTLPLLDAEAARRDYSLVLESLGSCGRTL